MTAAHPDEAAFLRAVLARPDDTSVRLIFADWLDERGDPRGEFVRIQIELARLPSPRCGCEGDYCTNPYCDWSDAFDALRRRERKLVQAHGRGWSIRDGVQKALCRPSLPLAENIRWEYRRGFVESVTLPAADFLRHAAALLAAAPLRTITLTDATVALTMTAEGEQAVSINGAAFVAPTPKHTRPGRLHGAGWDVNVATMTLAESHPVAEWGPGPIAALMTRRPVCLTLELTGPVRFTDPARRTEAARA